MSISFNNPPNRNDFESEEDYRISFKEWMNDVEQKKKLAIDILIEKQTSKSIEWLCSKGEGDFVSISPTKAITGGGFSFHYLRNKYKYKFDKNKASFNLEFNDEHVLHANLNKKGIDKNLQYKFDVNKVHSLKLYDWVEELPIIMNNELERIKTEKTPNQIKYDRRQRILQEQYEEEQKNLERKQQQKYIEDVTKGFSLGKYADPKSKDYKKYEDTKPKTEKELREIRKEKQKSFYNKLSDEEKKLYVYRKKRFKELESLRVELKNIEIKIKEEKASQSIFYEAIAFGVDSTKLREAKKSRKIIKKKINEISAEIKDFYADNSDLQMKCFEYGLSISNLYKPR